MRWRRSGEQKKTVDTVKQRGFFQSLCYCFRLSWKVSPCHFLMRFFGRLLVLLSKLALTYVAKMVIDLLSDVSGHQTEDKYTYLVVYLVISSGIRVLRNVSNSVSEYGTRIHSLLFDRLIAEKTIKIGCDSEYSLFDDPDEYGKLSTAINDSRGMSTIIWNAADCLSPMVAIICILCSVSVYSIWLGILMVLFFVPTALIRYRYTIKMYEVERKSIKYERQKQYYSLVASSKESAQDVRLFNMKDFLLKKYDETSTEELNKRKRIIKKEKLWLNIVDVSPEIVTLFFGVALVKGVLNNTATIGDYTLYIGMLIQLGSYIADMIVNCSKVLENRIRIANYECFMNRHELYEKKDVKKKEKLIISAVNSIEFKNVTFSYPNSGYFALDNVSFTIKAGEKVALVGKNGAGKTTIIKLLMGLYKPQKGDILINGISIRSISQKEMIKLIGVCIQNPITYGFSLLENIEFSDKKSDNRLAYNSLKIAGADRIIERSNGNMEMQMTRLFDKNGMVLSGGETQLLAIARAIYKESKVMILDEPSASLDPLAERQIFEFISRLPNSVPVLFSTHRMSNVGVAEKIIVIEDGKVVEIGKMQELLKMNGRFAYLYNC